jgi:hypothetical protein
MIAGKGGPARCPDSGASSVGDLKLSGAANEELQGALLQAFDYADLQRMVKFKFEIRLEDIVRPETTFRMVVFDLVMYAERKGWLDELVKGAHEFNPGNRRLAEFYKQHLGRDLATSSRSAIESSPTEAGLAQLNSVPPLDIEAPASPDDPLSLAASQELASIGSIGYAVRDASPAQASPPEGQPSPVGPSPNGGDESTPLQGPVKPRGSREASYRLHRAIGYGCFSSFVTAALASLSSAIIKLFTMNEASQTPLAFAAWSTVLAGSAIPVAMAFLKYT